MWDVMKADFLSEIFAISLLRILLCGLRLEAHDPPVQYRLPVHGSFALRSDRVANFAGYGAPATVHLALQLP